MSSSTVVERNLPCPCGQSSDAYQLYSDGHGYCYSATCGGKFFPAEKDDNKSEIILDEYDPNTKLPVLEDYGFRGWKERQLPRRVFEFYDIRCEVNAEGEPKKFFTPVYKPGTEELKGYRVRVLDVPKEESFYAEGSTSGIYGQNKFPGGGKRLVITEGVEDMLSIQEANYKRYNRTYPVVSISSASISKDQLHRS